MKSNVRAITPKPEVKPEAVDREKTCPLLLRVFTSKGKSYTFYVRLNLVNLIQIAITDQMTLVEIRLQQMNFKFTPGWMHRSKKLPT